jgi:hypothetical protein
MSPEEVDAAEMRLLREPYSVYASLLLHAPLQQIISLLSNSLSLGLLESSSIITTTTTTACRHPTAAVVSITRTKME